MLGSVVHFLEQHQGVENIRWIQREGVSSTDISKWEARTRQRMPEDLRTFYTVSDGLELRWSIKVANTNVPLGHMNINALRSLTVLDTDDEDVAEEQTRASASYVLDGSPNCQGKVVLYYKTKSDPQAWFISTDGSWHFVASSFTSFFRLVLMHLGLPGWCLAFTPWGMSATTKQWFRFLSPERCHIDECRSSGPRADALYKKKEGRKGRRKEKATGPPADVDVNKLIAADREKSHSFASTKANGSDSCSGTSAASSKRVTNTASKSLQPARQTSLKR
uniref:Knr4/Smi1-like domain-containing protein n=1 Tax=Eutreptiella gymnastica TaxID=73025 RepID=A0A7S1ITA6_9EUGL|mmetsp:Transcript_41133/g.73721  ORF Transcript_41133/g.73721 Transcript_41133/m.73721 type:complete len:278 (+) Transcript_41133:102-935(+)